MLRAGVAMALGTDSRASNPDLDLLAEMRFVREHHPRIAAEKVLALGTIDGARALGLASQCGSLTPGKRANLAILQLPVPCPPDAYEAVLRPPAHRANLARRAAGRQAAVGLTRHGLQAAVRNLRFQNGRCAERFQSLHDLNNLGPPHHHPHGTPGRVFQRLTVGESNPGVITSASGSLAHGTLYSNSE